MRPGVIKERRRFGRRAIFKRARIVLDSGEHVQCYAVNWSTGGALLDLRGADCSTEAFNLLVEEDDILVRCRIVHRTQTAIGVEFVRSPRRASRVGTPGNVRARIMASHLFRDVGSDLDGDDADAGDGAVPCGSPPQSQGDP